MTEPDEPLPLPLPDVGFNDPGAWGFCDYCAFLVAADPKTGLLFTHQYKSVVRDQRCNGSGRPHPEEHPVEARPRRWISLRHKERK